MNLHSLDSSEALLVWAPRTRADTHPPCDGDRSGSQQSHQTIPANLSRNKQSGLPREAPTICAEGGWPSLFGMFRSIICEEVSPACDGRQGGRYLRWFGHHVPHRASEPRRFVGAALLGRPVTQYVGEEESPSVSGKMLRKVIWRFGELAKHGRCLICS